MTNPVLQKGRAKALMMRGGDGCRIPQGRSREARKNICWDPSKSMHDWLSITRLHVVLLPNKVQWAEIVLKYSSVLPSYL